MPIAQDTPIVFLHGLGQGPESWDKVVDALQPPGRVLCPSVPALAGDGPLSFQSLCGGLKKALDVLDGPVHLCGLSLGAELALQYALGHPAKVRSLVLIAGVARSPKGLLRLQDVLFRFMPSRAFDSLGLQKRDARGLVRSMQGLDFTARLGGIACPTLVLCGSLDKPNRKAAQRLHDSIRGSQLVFVPGAGHEVNLHAPGGLAALLEDFWAR